jgi:energy-coupling factor transport system substrate-specific component
MSWGLASLLLLGGALGLGFAWYERSAPSPRLLAVVGTLAALAIVGRIAFAAIPNVKPTTDIVFVAGYALGGAPGFAVGAVAALVSNLFFGEGPWTPWQMAAWGLVGVFGAALAAASGRRLGRMPLALACAFAGLAFGAILDLSSWVTFTGRHTLSEYLAVSGTSLAFNLAHAIGNLVFFLAFGPALVRAVDRCRARFEIVWQPAVPLVLAVLLAGTLLGAGAARAAASAGGAAARGVAYLARSRNADGGWGGAPGQSSNGLHTAWAAYALAAAGQPVDASAVLVGRLGTGHAIGDVERTILGLRACGADPRDAGGRDLIAELLAKQARDGSFGHYVSYTSYAILALQSVGERTGLAPALRWLARQPNRDGGFNVFQRGGPSNPDDTAGAVGALAAAGRGRSAAVRHAVGYLRRAQHADGGYALAQGSPTNAQSTAFAALALQAGGANVAAVRRSGRSPLDYLRALQAPDGSFAYARGSHQTPVWVTAQAVLALEHRPLPVLAPAHAAAARATAAPRSSAVAVLASAIRVVRAIVATLAAL